jgi:hypothetical protein
MRSARSYEEVLGKMGQIASLLRVDNTDRRVPPGRLRGRDGAGREFERDIVQQELTRSTT